MKLKIVAIWFHELFDDKTKYVIRSQLKSIVSFCSMTSSYRSNLLFTDIESSMQIFELIYEKLFAIYYFLTVL